MRATLAKLVGFSFLHDSFALLLVAELLRNLCIRLAALLSYRGSDGFDQPCRLELEFRQGDRRPKPSL